MHMEGSGFSITLWPWKHLKVIRRGEGNHPPTVSQAWANPPDASPQMRKQLGKMKGHVQAHTAASGGARVQAQV